MAHDTGDDGTSLDCSCALILVDVQSGFDDPGWGSRNNPDADRNIAALADAFGASGRPMVHVRHDSDSPDSPLHPGRPGNRLKDYLSLVIAGITTNHCCETTARVGGNLGYDVLFALDATHTFDRVGPGGRAFSADELAAVTAANLHGEFATVTTTARLLAGLGALPSPSYRGEPTR